MCALAVASVLAGVAGASGKSPGPDQDYAQTALNVMPAGEQGSVPPPADATAQATLYDGLTPLQGNVTDADLTKYFKSERLGTRGQGPLQDEPTGVRGLRIVRDAYHVPHIYGTTDDKVTFGAGWVMGEDRGLLLEQARWAARVAAVGVPGVQALDLIVGLQSFTPSKQAEREVAKQAKVLRAAGAKGRAIEHDIDQFVAGINAYYRKSGTDAKPWTRNDVFALDAVKGQFVGEGGGGEVSRSMFLDALVRQLGRTKGEAAFADLRERDDPETPVSVPGHMTSQPAPKSTKGNVILDDGSFVAYESISVAPAPEQPAHASNALLVSGKRSATGHPLMVAGPQIGYFYPGLLTEVDLHGPHIHVRGAATVPLPGYVLIGRGSDFAWSLTSAGLDIVDHYAETLCGGSDHEYRYRGKCRKMEHFDAGVLHGETDQTVAFWRTVHGPVVGYATVHGKRVALARKRSTYGKDVLDLLLYRDLSRGKVRSVKDFFRAADQSPQTFNSFYVDSRDIGVFTSGLVPIRPSDVDPGLPIDGSGKHEWKGWVPTDRHPQGVNPGNGQIVNWNNQTIGGYEPGDDNWALGAEQRVRLLTNNLGKGGHQTLTSLTAAMNEAATQDVRAIELEPLLARVLRTGPAPSPRAEQMLRILDAWHANGGSRLDADLGGTIDDPGAAVMDAAWPGLTEAWGAPVLGALTGDLAQLMGRFSVRGGQYDGWHIYMDKDLRSLLHERVKGAFRTRFCGGGDLTACRTALWAALDAAGAALAATQGPDPAAWRADATAERIQFEPKLLAATMRYTNRPSGIQQVISFDRHR